MGTSTVDDATKLAPGAGGSYGGAVASRSSASLTAVPGRDDDSMRPELSEADAKQLIPILMAGIDREIASADAHYARGRNLVALVGTLFVAAQASFLASIDKSTVEAGRRASLVTAAEREDIIWWAYGSGALLLVAVLVLFLGLDRARKVPVVGTATIDAWPTKDDPDEPLAIYLVDALKAEQDRWSLGNGWRREAGIAVVVVALMSVACTIVEFALLYSYLT